MKKAKEKQRETLERQRKLDTRAKKSSGKAGLPKIVSNAMKNSAELSTAKIAGVHTEKIGIVRTELQKLRSSLSEINQMKFGFDNSKLHRGKNLFIANSINFGYTTENYLWRENLNFQINLTIPYKQLKFTDPNNSATNIISECLAMCSCL